MDVSEQQLRRWRDFMAQVYVATEEISQCHSKRNSAKMSVVLRYLAANALRCQVDLEQSTGLPPTPLKLPFVRLHRTEANERLLRILQLAMHTCSDVDDEKHEDDNPNSQVLWALIRDVEREVSGPFLNDEGPSLLIEEDDSPVFNAGLFGEDIYEFKTRE